MVKKRRRFMKLNLMETSAVGLPAYPLAHFSFIKALTNHTNTNERRFLNEKMTTDKSDGQMFIDAVKEIVSDKSVAKSEVKEEIETVKAESESEVKSEDVETQKAKKVEVKEEEDEESESDEDEDKSIAEMSELIQKAIADAVEKLSVKRGLVESDSKNELKNLSIGELAIKSGFLGSR